MTGWLFNLWLRISFILVFLAVGSGFGPGRAGSASSESAHSQSPPIAMISLAERRLRTAERQLQLRPKDAAAYAEMAAAYMEKARETGDGAFYGRAESACQKALQLEPNNYAALRLVSWVYSGQHRFREALVAARRALERDSRDPLNYGTLGDALLELGEYQEGAQAIQKMVDLRPDVASYARAAYVRELFGDMEGAIEIMGMAVRAASSRDLEHNAWCRVQLGHLLFNAGRARRRRSQYQAALQIFPGYHFAFTGLGRVRAAQQRLTRPSTSFKRVWTWFPRYEAVFGLADLYSHLKRPAETSRQFELLETLEKINQANGVQPEAQLAMFYADHGIRLTEALNIARQQARERRDIKTWMLWHGSCSRMEKRRKP